MVKPVFYRNFYFFVSNLVFKSNILNNKKCMKKSKTVHTFGLGKLQFIKTNYKLSTV